MHALLANATGFCLTAQLRHHFCCCLQGLGAILPCLSKAWSGIALVNLLQHIEHGQMAYIRIPVKLWDQLSAQRRSEVCSLLAAHGLLLAIPLQVGCKAAPAGLQADLGAFMRRSPYICVYWAP